MLETLKEEAARIQALVRSGTSFLGICAGAIAASRHPLLVQESEARFFSSELPCYLNLYSGFCALAEFPGSSICGVQKARTEGVSVPLFFKKGVFFPFPKDSTTHPLLWYENPLLQRQWHYDSHSDSYPPVAAVAAMCEAGRVVLSGLHPELNSGDLAGAPFYGPEEALSIPQTIRDLTGTEEPRAQIMKTFLRELAIGLKTP